MALRVLAAGKVARRVGGGFLSSVAVFAVVYWLTGLVKQPVGRALPSYLRRL